MHAPGPSLLQGLQASPLDKNFVPRMADLEFSFAGSTQSFTPSRTSNNINVDGVIDRALKAIDDFDTRVQVGVSSRKRSRIDV